MVTSDRKAEVDLRPIVVSEIVVDGERLVAREPLEFEVSFDAEEAIYDLEGPLRIYLFAETREVLDDMLHDVLEVMWRDFAAGEHQKLSGDAQKIGRELRKRFAGVGSAA